MKFLFAASALTIAITAIPLTGCTFGQSGSSRGAISGARTPKDLLVRILELSRKKNYVSLKDCIYPLEIGTDGMVVSSRDAAIMYIREADKRHTGDFSFSDEALELVVRQYADNFIVAPTDDGMNEFYKWDNVLSSLPKKSFALLRLRATVDIVVVNTGDGFRLLFWEGMNKLLEDNIRSSKDSKSQRDGH